MRARRTDRGPDGRAVQGRIGAARRAGQVLPLEAGNDVDTLAQLQHFRDETQSTVASLETVSAHASDHPAGFKELQIALREAVRQMDDILLVLPPDKHPWFRAVRSDLVDSQNRLIELLFPPQPHKSKNPPPS